MSLAGRLDDLLRERVFQRIADAVRDRTGASCFALAAQAALAIASTSVAWCAMRAAILGELGGDGVVVAAAGLFCGFGSYAQAASAERQFAARQALPLIPAGFFCRMSFVIFLAWDLADIGLYAAGIMPLLLALKAIRTATDIAFLSYYYFMACRPKPPRRQESRVPANAVPAGAS
jgi:hypothetical protein